eukprot:gb/GECG01014399.1/.p1 GENE.gb/GECG01014399.1/~~gb/GECG01014399.1/.p1  ORF type:complete len:567 (+),score=36.56 gb/GECG01014399.1/:1-1701(+)
MHVPLLRTMEWLVTRLSAVCLVATFLQVGGGSYMDYNEPHEVFTLSRHSIQVPHQVDEYGEPLGARSWRDLMVENGTRSSRNLFWESVPVNGPFRDLAYFYSDAWVGTPATKFSVIVDTGSSLMAFPCKGCKTCGKHEGHRYDPAKSSTSEKVKCRAADCFGSCNRQHNQCSYNQRYSEGSQLSGLVYKDVTFLDFPTPGKDSEDMYGIKYSFGCHTIERGKLFHEQLADGILGLANRKQSFIAALKKSKKLSNNQFSMCLDFKGGSLRLGGPNLKLHTSDMKWTKMKSTSSYGIKASSMELSGTRITSKTLSGIVDSGTTFTMVPRSQFESIKKGVANFCSKSDNCRGAHATRVSGESLCWKLDHPENITSFPSLTITLSGNVPITIAPHHLFVNMVWDQQGKAYCLAVYPDRRQRVLLGANAMMSYDYLFDLSSGKLGIAPANCRKPENETEFNRSPGLNPPKRDSKGDSTSDKRDKQSHGHGHSTSSDKPKNKETTGGRPKSNSSPSVSHVYAVGVVVGITATAFTLALIVLAMTYCGGSLNIGSYQPMTVPDATGERGYAQV